ncbi:DUF5305 domain-containing protein [Lederbergia panacisoli]|uniref:DUF5305 domain-containing protein n=1 Tax=Lederbergia panacisoli TaxID=1255251 RepID=UPI00214B1747|nr:DUF5305 domain-containing protein [Lederbergia panacisoli]MCR2823284.1 DUF5305 domain-containing protein [Lederbergia panacisoli]
MSKRKKNNFKLKNKKQRKFINSILIGLSIVATVLLYYILVLPLETMETNTENNITQETVFTFKADVAPFALHPKGGIVDIEGGSFTEVTNDIIVNVKSSIKSNKPIKVNGSKEIVLNLVANGLWQKDFLLGKEDSFELEGTNIDLIDKDYPINLKQLEKFMNDVEKSINAIPSSYNFEISPIITGKITYNDKEISIAHNARTNLEYSRTQITLGDETSLVTTTPISSTSAIQRVFYPFGKEVSLWAIKVVSVVMYLLLLAAILMIARYIKANTASSSSEKERIDKKYKARMVSVLQSNISTIDSNKRVVLDSFSSLLKISDEKDAIIYTYEDSGSGKKDYYVIDEGYVFIYQTSIISGSYTEVG